MKVQVSSISKKKKLIPKTVEFEPTTQMVQYTTKDFLVEGEII